jgi:hypothetical protein
MQEYASINYKDHSCILHASESNSFSFLLLRIDTHTSTLRGATVIPCTWGL